MDDDLRNGLWNAITRHYLPVTDLHFSKSYSSKILYKAMLEDFLKVPSDNLPDYISDIRESLRKIYFELEWHEVYDFVEFLANFRSKNYSAKSRDFIMDCNAIMEREFSAYRFVSGYITKLTSKGEIIEIEKAIESPVQASNTHIETALRLLSDRANPDYRNSIKESISAVEAVCQKISEKPSATLTDALNHLAKQRRIIIPASLKIAFEKIYGYTSSSDGIRHALSKQTDVGYEDAIFMLISCSAFTNYLITKAVKSNIF